VEPSSLQSNRALKIGPGGGVSGVITVHSSWHVKFWLKWCLQDAKSLEASRRITAPAWISSSTRLWGSGQLSRKT